VEKTMTTKMKLLGSIAAIATVFGLGATAVAFSDTIDQAVTSIEQGASSEESDATSWRTVWRWNYRPAARYYGGYRYAGYRYYGYRYAGYRYYGPSYRYGTSYRRAWVPGRWSLGRGWYHRGYYRYW
jgi:hypothetical protein